MTTSMAFAYRLLHYLFKKEKCSQGYLYRVFCLLGADQSRSSPCDDDIIWSGSWFFPVFIGKHHSAVLEIPEGH